MGKVFHLSFSHVHVLSEIAKRHLRFDHPKLCGMPRGIRVLSTERRPKCIDFPQRRGHRFAFQLAADRQKRLFGKKILREIIRARSQRRHPKHLPRPFTITRRDDRSMHIKEPALLEKPVHRISQPRPHPENRPIQRGARSQMSNRPQELRRMALFLQRKRFVRPAK